MNTATDRETEPGTNGQHAGEAEPEARLKWEADEDNAWRAANTAGVTVPDDEPTPTVANFYVDEMVGPSFEVDTREPLFPAGNIGPSTFPTLEAAQAFCEARNAELTAAVEAQDDNPPRDAPMPPDVAGWALIVKARHDERQAEGRVSEAQAELKSAKADLDAASERLGRLIDETDQPGLFGGETASAGRKPAQNITENITAPAEDTAWRPVLLRDLDLPTRAYNLLNDNGLDTLGLIEDWRARGYTDPTIKGTGEGSATREAIDNAAVNHLQRFTKPSAAPPSPLQTSLGTPAEPTEPGDWSHEREPTGEELAEVAIGLNEAARPETIDLAGHGLVSIQQTPAGFTYGYNVRCGKHADETGDHPIGPFTIRNDAVKHAAGRIMAWLGKLGQKGGLRGEGTRIASEIKCALDGALPLKLAEACA